MIDIGGKQKKYCVLNKHEILFQSYSFANLLIIILPWMWIDPFKLLESKCSSLSEAIVPPKDRKMLLLKLLLLK